MNAPSKKTKSQPPNQIRVTNREVRAVLTLHSVAQELHSLSRQAISAGEPAHVGKLASLGYAVESVSRSLLSEAAVEQFFIAGRQRK